MDKVLFAPPGLGAKPPYPGGAKCGVVQKSGGLLWSIMNVVFFFSNLLFLFFQKKKFLNKSFFFKH
jgi:hypothetical protein